MGLTIIERSLKEKIDDKHFVKNVCRTCFMNGESCIYRYDIVEHNQKVKFVKDSSAFVLMPFGGTLEQVYNAQIKPCLHHALTKNNNMDDCNVYRSDDASSGAGYIICQRICRQIQESQLVCAEISTYNSNVYYELGFAYALERDIALFVQEKGWKKIRNKIMNDLGVFEEHVNAYVPFEMLYSKDVVLWDFEDAKIRWEKSGNKNNNSSHDNIDHVNQQKDEGVVKKEVITIILADTTCFYEEVSGRKLKYAIHDLARSAIHGAIEEIKYKNQINEWSGDNIEIHDIVVGNPIDRDDLDCFFEIKKKVEESSIVIICTSQDQPISYFWIGFLHGKEKTVIPITPLKPKTNDANIRIEDNSDLENKKEKVPFDVRALWHIHFYCNEVDKLQWQIKKMLENILTKNRDKYAQKIFWREIEENSSVSIYVGSSKTDDLKRHAVGEWDFKTVAELTGYYTLTNKAIKLNIEAPIIKLNYGAEDFTNYLTEKLFKNNSIIIGTPDINDISEIALSISTDLMPYGDSKSKGLSKNIISVKSIPKTNIKYNYFIEYSGKTQQRGFYEYDKGVRVDGGSYISKYIDYDVPSKHGYSEQYAYIAKYRIYNVKNEGVDVVMLQGSTGPSTLAIAQMLTGCINSDYTIFSDKKDYHEKVDIIKKIYKKYEYESLCLMKEELRLKKRTDLHQYYKSHLQDLCGHLNDKVTDYASVEAIMKVFVVDGGKSNTDERLIAWIEFMPGFPRVKDGANVCKIK